MESIDRREFVTGLAAGAAAMMWPSLGRAEDPIALLKILFG